MILRRIFLLPLFALSLLSCNENGNDAMKTGTLRVNYSVVESNTDTKVSPEVFEQNLPAQAAITLKDSKGDTVMNAKKFGLSATEGNYVSESITLRVGEYTLEEFVVLDSTGEALYIAPQTGSQLAGQVTEPLSQSVIIEKNTETTLQLQVLAADLGFAFDFGYTTFRFNPSLCGTYEEDKQKSNVCYTSKECLIGKWKFKAFIEETNCFVKYTPDTIWGKPTSKFEDILWIEFQDNDTIVGKTVTNGIGGTYKLQDNNILQIHGSALTEINEPEWGEMFKTALFGKNPPIQSKFISFDDTLFIYNSNSKMLFIKEKEINITKRAWKLRSVTSGNKTLCPQKSDYIQDNAYLLEFNSDSTFWLPTSVNMAGGDYEIIENGIISILDYHEVTEVATNDSYERKLNSNLISVFNKVTNYEVISDTLHFKGKDCEVIFNKK